METDDLNKGYENSRAMVAEYGMGTELKSRRLPVDDYSLSDATRRMVDDEQQHITELAHRRALRLIVDNRSMLEAFAATLLENEVLERSDIERIVAAHASPDAAPVEEDAVEEIEAAAQALEAASPAPALAGMQSFARHDDPPEGTPAGRK